MPERRSRLFSWLNTWRDDELSGRLLQIFITAAAGEPMRAVDEIECVPGRGLAGDRYALGGGHWIKTDGCEVTLITRQELRTAERRGGIDLSNGRHRRNLVVDGIPPAAFRRHALNIGDVRFAFHRLRPPCAYLDRVAGSGLCKALGKGAGIGLRVVGGGRIRVGDVVRVDQDSAG